MPKFKLHSEFKPTGDQPQAIKKLAAGVGGGMEHQVLLGVTGSGKTFTIANVIERVQKPTLIISHNKTLAAQLFQEFREFFPENAVHYFVSYYDYYQPEAYVPQRDLYIEKEVDINKKIEILRHSTTEALMTRNDVIVVASVSCIYGLGRPEDYASQHLRLRLNERKLTRDSILRKLVQLLYQRNDWDFRRGCFRVRGDTVEVYPPYGETILRLGFLGDTLTAIKWVEATSGRTVSEENEAVIFAAAHFVTSEKRLKRAMSLIKEELEQRLAELKSEGKDLEAHRLKQRTEYDLELMEELGFCPGIENYSRYLSGREEGEPPYTLIDYFRHPVLGSQEEEREFLCVVDESHMTIPQIRGMYNGDRARKEVLVEYGFRLPSALDNRPLKFNEFQVRIPQMIYTSATPAEWEIEMSLRSAKGVGVFPKHRGVVEQLIRPTGLLDPEIEIRPTNDQIKDLILEIIERKGRGERVLVTTLTKRMAEDLADYLSDFSRIKTILKSWEFEGGIRTRFLHSEVKTLTRSDILADLRKGKYDVIVGINLLREGLDLPEVSLVAILDADKEGFLRSETSLIQTMGRAARHIHGKVILYADNITDSMRRAISEVERRRNVQKKYNAEHGIVPKGIKKPVREKIIEGEEATRSKKFKWQLLPPEELENKIWEWEREMRKAADILDFEKAAELRDLIREARKNFSQ